MPEQPGCVQLVGLEKAKTHHALTDDACPTICIVHYLQSHLKWRPVKHLVVHTLENQADLVFDDRESMRMKKYYLCCVNLSKCLALTSSMPSQQPVTYYKCLLAGLAVEPHQTDKFYHDVFNRHCKAKGKAPLPLPAPDPVPPLRYDDDDDAVMVGVDPPRKNVKSAPTGVGRLGLAGLRSQQVRQSLGSLVAEAAEVAVAGPGLRVTPCQWRARRSLSRL